MTNDRNLEDILSLAISNLASMCEDLEDRISYLEEAHNQMCAAATDERCGSTVPANGFDLARYRKLLETCIASRKQSAKEETHRNIYYERCLIKIEAYEHALRLLDA